MTQSILVGIAGGTGSGKTTVAKKLSEAFQEESIIMDMDSYYRDLGHLTLQERKSINFDHPDAIEIDLYINHLQRLKQGYSINKPLYNFEVSTRRKEVQAVDPRPIIIVEGVLVLATAELRDILDFKVYVDTDDDIRMIRRIERDVSERGRTLNGIVKQYLSTVRPMHLSFVEPSKRYADIVVPRGGNNEIAIEMLISALKLRLT